MEQDQLPRGPGFHSPRHKEPLLSAACPVTGPSLGAAQPTSPFSPLSLSLFLPALQSGSLVQDVSGPLLIRLSGFMNVLSLREGQVEWTRPGEPGWWLWPPHASLRSVVRWVRGCQEWLAWAFVETGPKRSKTAKTKRPASYQSLSQISDQLTLQEALFQGTPNSLLTDLVKGAELQCVNPTRLRGSVGRRV